MAAAHSNDIKGHAIQDGGMTPALPQGNPRPPAYCAAGALWQPDFGLQEGSCRGRPTGNTRSGLQSACSAASDRIFELLIFLAAQCSDAVLHHYLAWTSLALFCGPALLHAHK